ncbi:MAG: DUF3822 family protein [Tannerellaceae bacterium]
MTISIPDTLTTDNSEKYSVSIRLSSGGLSFSGYDTLTSGHFFYRSVEFDRSKPFLASLKEFFFAHSFLAYTYKHTYVVCVSPEYALVPDAMFDEDQQESMQSFNFSAPQAHCLSNPLKEEHARLLFGMDEEVYEFCSRSLANPRFVHSVTPLLCLWKRQSSHQLSKKMYVVIHRKAMDVVCYAQGKLLFANSFEAEQSSDRLYYILHVWRQVGMNQLKDQLFLSGETVLRTGVEQTLQAYLQNIALIEIPSEAYLMGTDVAKAPADLIALATCEGLLFT